MTTRFISLELKLKIRSVAHELSEKKRVWERKTSKEVPNDDS